MSTVGSAQRPTTRDSAGVEIVSSAAPALPRSKAARFDPSPLLMIGEREGAPYVFARIVGGARLSNGAIVVADGASTELRLFDARGNFVKLLGRKGGGPGEFASVESLIHLRGDTLALVAGFGSVVYYDGAGAFVRGVSLMRSPIPGFAGPKAIVGAFGDGTTAVMAIGAPTPHARGERWLQSTSAAFLDPGGAVLQPLGRLPVGVFVMGTHPRPPWLAATLAMSNSDQSLFIGLGTEYSIREYARDGRLARIIRRAWAPVRITGGDINRFVDEWGERWIRSTGAEAERERAALRDDPYERIMPAFSQLLVDRTNRLWVRTPNVRDAAATGQLNSRPLVPSAWSVFDQRGVWLYDVILPANLRPLEIGADHLLAVVHDDDGAETIGLYRLLHAP